MGYVLALKSDVQFGVPSDAPGDAVAIDAAWLANASNGGPDGPYWLTGTNKYYYLTQDVTVLDADQPNRQSAAFWIAGSGITFNLNGGTINYGDGATWRNSNSYGDEYNRMGVAFYNSSLSGLVTIPGAANASSCTLKGGSITHANDEKFAVTGAASTNVLTISGTSFVDGTSIVFSSITGSDLVAGRRYYVRDASGSTFRVSESSGGSAVSLGTDMTAGEIPKACQCHAVYMYHPAGNTVRNIHATVHGNDSFGLYIQWDTGPSASIYDNIFDATGVLTCSNRQHQPACIKATNYPVNIYRNLIMGGNAGVSVAYDSDVYSNVISQDGFATNGYGVLTFSTSGVSIDDNIVIPTSGRGVMFDDSVNTWGGGKNNAADSNVILHWEHPNPEFGTHLNPPACRMRYNVWNNSFTNNFCLGVGGVKSGQTTSQRHTGASTLYLTVSPYGNPYATCTTGCTTTSLVYSSINKDEPTSTTEQNYTVGATVRFTSTTTTAALRSQTSVVTAYNYSTNTFTVSPALPATPASGDVFEVQINRSANTMTGNTGYVILYGDPALGADPNDYAVQNVALDGHSYYGTADDAINNNTWYTNDAFIQIDGYDGLAKNEEPMYGNSFSFANGATAYAAFESQVTSKLATLGLASTVSSAATTRINAILATLAGLIDNDTDAALQSRRAFWGVDYNGQSDIIYTDVVDSTLGSGVSIGTTRRNDINFQNAIACRAGTTYDIQLLDGVTPLNTAYVEVEADDFNTTRADNDTTSTTTDGDGICTLLCWDAAYTRAANSGVNVTTTTSDSSTISAWTDSTKGTLIGSKSVTHASLGATLDITS